MPRESYENIYIYILNESIIINISNYRSRQTCQRPRPAGLSRWACPVLCRWRNCATATGGRSRSGARPPSAARTTIECYVANRGIHYIRSDYLIIYRIVIIRLILIHYIIILYTITSICTIIHYYF